MGAIHIGEDQVLVNHWLQALNAKTGLTLRLDEHGVCAVGHTSGLDCAIEVPDGRRRVYLYIPLMPWVAPPLALAEHCLAENFLGVSADGACFAIDRAEGQVVVWLTRRLEALDEESFCRLVVEFFETAVQRREELESFCRCEVSETNPRLERQPVVIRG